MSRAIKYDKMEAKPNAKFFRRRITFKDPFFSTFIVVYRAIDNFSTEKVKFNDVDESIGVPKLTLLHMIKFYESMGLVNYRREGWYSYIYKKPEFHEIRQSMSILWKGYQKL